MEMCTESATSWIIDLYWFYDKEGRKRAWKNEHLNASELPLLKGVINMKGCFFVSVVSTE